MSDEKKSFTRASTNRSVNKNTRPSLCPRSICNVPHSSLSPPERYSITPLSLIFLAHSPASFHHPDVSLPALHLPGFCFPPQTFQQNTLKDRGQNRHHCNRKCIFGTRSELSADIERLQIWVGWQFIWPSWQPNGWRFLIPRSSFMQWRRKLPVIVPTVGE